MMLLPCGRCGVTVVTSVPSGYGTADVDEAGRSCRCGSCHEEEGREERDRMRALMAL